ncbi:MAG TPA: YceI family protein [Dehalococcoidia bacterium]
MTAQAPAATTWRIDPVHSTVKFALTHMPFSMFHCRFRDFEGEILLDEREPANSTVAATIQADSIDVPGERFLAVMQGEDFFDTARWPSLAFRSTGVRQSDGDVWQVTGDLTIRGVTRSVVLVTRYAGQGRHPVSGRILAGFHVETAIDRRDFGMVWNRLLETGAPYLGTEVSIVLDIEAVKQESAAT